MCTLELEDRVPKMNINDGLKSSDSGLATCSSTRRLEAWDILVRSLLRKALFPQAVRPDPSPSLRTSRRPLSTSITHARIEPGSATEY